MITKGIKHGLCNKKVYPDCKKLKSERGFSYEMNRYVQYNISTLQFNNIKCKVARNLSLFSSIYSCIYDMFNKVFGSQFVTIIEYRIDNEYYVEGLVRILRF